MIDALTAVSERSTKGKKIEHDHATREHTGLQVEHSKPSK